MTSDRPEDAGLDSAQDPAPDPAMDPALDAAQGPAPDSAMDPTPDSAMDPAPDPAMDPALDAAQGPAPDSAMDPSPDSAMDPSPDSAMDPTPDSAMDPAPDSAMDPSPDSAADPTPDSATDPAPDSALDPAPNSATDPAPDSAMDPALDAAQGPAPDSARDSSPDSAGDSAPDPAMDPVRDAAQDPAPDWLARRARLSGGRVALVELDEGGAEVTYRAWNARVNQTARALRDRFGVRPGDRVALLAQNRAAWLDVWLACGKLGAVLLALNWRLPAGASKILVERSGAMLLVHDAEHAALARAVAGTEGVGRGADGGTPLARLDAVVEARAGLDPSDLTGPRPRLDDPWVLCLTGGTTGTPKMAVLTHGNILWNAIGTAASWDLHRGARGLLNAPLFHTGGMNVLTAPLVWVGGTSVVCRGFDPGQVLDQAASGGITHLFGVPTMFEMILRHPGFAAADLSRLELVISGGAPCPTSIFEAFWEKGVDFKTGYGLTEAGPNNFWLPDDEVRAKPGWVGYPLLHVETKVVDDRGRPVGQGEAGELLLRGPHVTPGYFGDEAATCAALDPEGWLRTGDLAVVDADGAHRIVGRKKDMYISGGENVYPAEVESVLFGHPDVVEVAVIGVPDPKWGEVGHAFLARSDPALDADALRSWLEGRLAKYQQPAGYTFVGALPKTGAGKVDRKALAATEPNRAVPPRAGAPKR